jgi:hypothetical protein
LPQPAFSCGRSSKKQGQAAAGDAGQWSFTAKMAAAGEGLGMKKIGRHIHVDRGSAGKVTLG